MKISQLERAIAQLESEIAVLEAARQRLIAQRPKARLTEALGAALVKASESK